MLPRTARLRRTSDFKRVYDQGFSRAGRHVVIYRLARDGETPRLGLSVSRKVGGAAARNKVRRRLSEAYLAAGAADGDVIIVARPPAAEASYQILEREVKKLLLKAAEQAPEGGRR